VLLEIDHPKNTRKVLKSDEYLSRTEAALPAELDDGAPERRFSFGGARHGTARQKLLHGL